jgi:5-formyltetrahydrofolate cyclo-ligase
MDLVQRKAELREAVKQRLRLLSLKERAAEGRSLCRRVAELLPRGPLTICGYLPLRDEADIRPLLRALLKHYHTLYLPRTEGGAMVFRRVQDLQELKPGAYAIPEPSGEAPILDRGTVTHVLVPGRAFDRQGNRLGRGNGGYDHWLRTLRSLNPTVKVWGMCLECQLMLEVPVEQHDEPMNAVITARGVTYC